MIGADPRSRKRYGGFASLLEKSCLSGIDPIVAIWRQCERVVVVYVIYIGAALAEIAGCFAFWAWLRLDRSALWLIPGIGSLCLFAYLLTLVSAEHAGRTYAAYGGLYIASALIWLWVAEGIKPDRWDLIGGAVCLVGASVILWGPRPI